MNKKIMNWKYLIVVVSLLVSIQPLNANAAQIILKPGATVSPTSKEILKVGSVGFQDESYCADLPSDGKCSPYAEYDRTSWAFSVKNASPTRSATNIKAQVTFFDSQGKTIFQKIVTVAHELKPGKITYSASTSDSGSDYKFKAASTATVKILSKSWIVPTKSVVQGSLLLESTSVTHSFRNNCQLTLICGGSNDPNNLMKYLDLKGVYPWRGGQASQKSLIIYLDASDNPIGGWQYGSSSFSGNTKVEQELELTSSEVANIVNYLFTPTT